MKSIAIVGGGPGGLFCAYLLNQKVPDAQITVFEASDRLGGKIFTDEFSDGTPFEAGVAELYEYLGPGGKDPMRQLFEEDLGLRTVDMRGGCVVLYDRVLRDLDELEKEHGERTRRNVEDFHKLMVELMPLEKYANRWQPDNSHPWANDRFHDLLRSTVKDDPEAVAYIEAAVHSDLATEPHTCNGLNAIKNVLMDNDEYMQVYHVAGGLSKIPEALTAKIRATFNLLTRVTAVERDADSYELVHRANFDESYEKVSGQYTITCQQVGGGETRKQSFDAVFLCIPNHWLTQIDYKSAKLDAALHRIVSHYDLPAHYLRVSLLYERPWWNAHNIPNDFFMLDSFNGCCAYNESYRWRSQKGHVLSLLLAGQDALLLCSSDQSDEDVVEYILDGLPDFMRIQARGQLVEAQVDRFVGSINAQPGGWPTKDLRGEHQPEPDEHPDLYLTGDYLFDSTLNAALFSANTAVNLLVERLGIDLRRATLTPAVEALGGPEEPL